jgi:predicted nucleotidyltransferase
MQSQLDDLVRRIVEAVHPLRIILFGSAARGGTTPDSDVDLLVVMPEGTHRRHTAQHLYRSICGVTIPFDVLVATRGDLERHRDNPGLVYRTILREGKTIYAA